MIPLVWVQDKAYSDLMRELWGSPGQWNVRKSYVAVARKLGVDEETVRNRIRAMKESGFLLGWRLLPNAALFGLRPTFLLLRFEDEAAKEEAVPRLSSADGVFVLASLYGNSVLITLYDDAEDRAFSKAIANGEGVRAKTFSVPEMGLPPTRFKMTPTDWQIVRLMLHDAERNVGDVASEARLSARTVKRRLNAMMAASAIFITPMVDLRKSAGIPYQIIVQCRGEGDAAEVQRLVSSKIQNLVFRSSGPGGALIFGFTGSNVAEGSELLKYLKSQPEIRSLNLNIVEKVIHAFDWIEKEVARAAGLEPLPVRG